MVTHSPSTSEIGSLMWKSWLLLTDGWQFTVQNLYQLYILVSSAHKTTHQDMTGTVLKTMLLSKIKWKKIPMLSVVYPLVITV